MSDLIAPASSLVHTLKQAGLMVATAESCTGGLIAATLTEIAGSSAVVDRGFVTYSNEAKNEMLGVPMDLIEANGAVSEHVARAMAEGALARSRADQPDDLRTVRLDWHPCHRGCRRAPQTPWKTFGTPGQTWHPLGMPGCASETRNQYRIRPHSANYPVPRMTSDFPSS